MDMSRRHTRLVFLPFPALPSSYLGTEEKKRVRVGSAKEMWRRRQTTTKRTTMMILMMMAAGVRRRRRRVASTSVRNCYDPAATLISAIFFSTAAAAPAVIAPWCTDQNWRFLLVPTLSVSVCLSSVCRDCCSSLRAHPDTATTTARRHLYTHTVLPSFHAYSLFFTSIPYVSFYILSYLTFHSYRMYLSTYSRI